MLDFGEAVGGADLLHPGFDGVLFDLLGAPAFAAHEVMVVTGVRAEPEEGFALGRSEDVDALLVGEGLEVAVDGRKADAIEPLVQLLRAERGVGGGKRSDDRGLLCGRARLLRGF